MRSTSGPSPSLDIPPYHSSTMKSTTSIKARRPFLSLSAGSAAANIRYATPVSSDHGHGNLYSRASHRASEAHPAASTDHLPIAARFARRVSIDSPPACDNSKGDINNSSTNTAHTAVEESPQTQKHERRDISGGSGTTAVDSGDDTDYSLPKNHVQFGALHAKGKGKSRLHPFFANLGHTPRSTEKANISALESSTSVNAQKTFKHHLKSLVPPVPNKLHKVSSPDFKDSNGRLGLAGPGWVVKDLPPDLKTVSEVVANQILAGHRGLSERLRARYEEQFRKSPYLLDTILETEHMLSF